MAKEELQSSKSLSISQVVTPSNASTTIECCLNVEGEIQPDGNTSASEHIIITIECCRICLEEDIPDNLIKLSCNCQGDLSKAHRVCIFQWFGVRMWLNQNYTCELCSVNLVSIEEMVNVAAMAHGEGHDILIEAVQMTMVKTNANYNAIIQTLEASNLDSLENEPTPNLNQCLITMVLVGFLGLICIGVFILGQILYRIDNLAN